MKKLLLASAALMALSIGGNAVQAADMPVKAVAPVPVFTWSGCYVGVQVGYKWGESVHTATGLAADGTYVPAAAGQDITSDINVNGILGGVEAGCQYQWGNWVWGIEGDGSWVAAEGQGYYRADLPAVFNPAFVSKTSERSLFTLRGRLGWAVWDKWLWYVTAGGAWANLDITVFNGNNPGNIASTAIDSVSASGWVAGWGTEYALGNGWSVKSETLYVDFGSVRARTLAPVANPLCCYERDVELHQWIWRVGMNYRFDWGKGVGK
jgi:outer membrane immunogenic protein